MTKIAKKLTLTMRSSFKYPFFNTIFFKLVFSVFTNIIFTTTLHSQKSEYKEVLDFYKIKSLSTKSNFVKNLRDFYLEQNKTPYVYNKRLNRITALLNNDCDRIEFLCARINYLIYSAQVKEAIQLKKQLLSISKNSNCSYVDHISKHLAISNIDFLLGDFEKAKKNYFHILNVANKNNDTNRVIAISINIGNAFLEEGKENAAKYYYLNALNKIGDLDYEFESEAYVGLSRVFLKQRNFKTSLFYLNKSLEHTENDLERSYINFLLGSTYFSLNNKKKMLDHYSIALDLSHYNLNLQKNIYQELETYYKTNTEFDKAYSFSIKSDSIDDLIDMNSQKMYLDSLSFEENLRFYKLNKRKIEQKLVFETKEKKIFFSSLIITLFLLVIVTYLMAKQNKTNRNLIRKNIEILKSTEISKNLILDDQISNEQKNTTEELKTSDFLPPKDLIIRLEKLLNEKELFKTPNLTIQKLALKLNVNPDLLSKVINSHYQVPFRNLINTKRIELTMNLLLDDDSKQFSIEGIAKSAGYTNMATFYNNFKQITGVTPTNFIRYGKKINEELNKE